MATADIAAAIRRTEQILLRRPSTALRADTPAHCRWVGGVGVVIGDGSGREVATDLPAALGGAGAAFSPGWLLRAGLAACTATSIAMLAASEGIDLTQLDLEARSRSDTRGLLGMTDTTGVVDPGLRDVVLSVRIAARNATPDRLRQLVEAAHAASPVLSTFQNATPVSLSIATDP